MFIPSSCSLHLFDNVLEFDPQDTKRPASPGYHLTRIAICYIELVQGSDVVIKLKGS